MLNTRRYYLELGGALALYVGLLVAANLIDRAVHPEGMARLALALSPMVGAIAAAGAVLRAIGRMDELQRRIQLDAIAFSFLGTALVTFGWGFAEDAGLPRLEAFAVWPIMGSLWMVGLLVARQRYR
jgi:hypothetical protein